MTFILFPSLYYILQAQFIVMRETQMYQAEKGAPDTFVLTCLKSYEKSHQQIVFWSCVQLHPFFPHMDNLWPERKGLYFQLQE